MRQPSKVVSVMVTFFFLMTHHSEIQERAREEIDSVLGGNMATHDDRPSLPYVNAMIKEILRWGPVVPLGELVRLQMLMDRSRPPS
jgi:cytochrome P450